MRGRPIENLLLNEHREALAFVAVEIGDAPSIDDARRLAQSLGWRCHTLKNPDCAARYVQVRGFDPREAHPAPQLRWLG